MKPALCALWLAVAGTTVLGQAPATSTPAQNPGPSDLGFQFVPPPGWQIVPTPQSPPATGPQPVPGATEKKGTACIQIPFTASYGDPRSVMVEVVLPFACYGQIITQDQLPDFASGTVEGMKQSLDISDSAEKTYTLGTHSVWAQRSTGNTKGAEVKGQTGAPFTVEIACSLLHKSAVCWAVAASDSAALADFEHASVTLDSDPPAALVPASVFP